MKTVRHSKVNPLVNPVECDDVIIAESGEKCIVGQNMRGEYWLKHILGGSNLTCQIACQSGICYQISQLANI